MNNLRFRKPIKPNRLNWKIVLFSSSLFLYSNFAEANSFDGINAIPTAKVGLQQTVNGTVLGNDGQPLAGVTVTVKGTTTRSSSDADGKFSIAVPSTSSTLVFSYVGYQTKEVLASAASTVNMTSSDEVLDEVVIVGFGTQKKKDLTGAITQVNADQINNRPVANLGQALKGLIPNLNATTSNGSPNTSTNLNVRGTTSLSYNTTSKQYQASNGSPLILVDGIQMDFNNINPEDVESVTTLKDASASAIYGSRAAFGVVLITTKSGKAGRSNVDYSNSFQWSKATAIPDVMNAYDLQDAYIKGFALQNGQTAGAAELEKLEKIKEYMANPTKTSPYYLDAKGSPVWVANINPYHEALAPSSPMQKHTLSISGGNDKVTYYTSMGYQNQDGIYRLNTDKLNRYNVIANVGVKVNEWFKIDTRNNYSYKRYTEPVYPSGKGGWWTALAQEPGRNVNMPLFTPDDFPGGRFYTDNILSFMDYGSRTTDNDENMLILVNPTITPLPGWNIRGDLSYKTVNTQYKRIIPILNRIEPGGLKPVNSHTNPSSIYDFRSRSNQYTINLYTDYTKSFESGHNISGLLGYNQEWYNYNSISIDKKDITDGIDYANGATGRETVGDDFADWAVRGIFYRLSYDYQGKYLIQSNGRYDGSSRFPKDRRFHFFPSVSAGWVVSQENFAQDWNNVISFLKIRGSYGSIGNQEVNYYDYIPLLGQFSNLPFELDGIRPSYINAPGLIDANFTWETATTLNIGADLTLFKNLEINFDWFKRNTTDILTDGASYPAVLGAKAPVSNTGELQSKGWEFIAKYKNETNFGLGYDVALTLGDYQSKVITYLGNANNLLSLLYSGGMIGDIWGYETYGLFQNAEEIAAVNPAVSQKNLGTLWYPGDVRYVDLDGDGTITTGNNTLEDHGDRKIIGNSTPRYSYGLNANLRYKGFDFNVFLQGVGKRDVWIDNLLYWGVTGTGTYDVYNDSWTPENTGAKFPGYYSAGKNRQVQTRYLENGAYLRLKNLSLGYTLPTTYAEAIKFKRIKLNVSAFNLLEFKKVPKTFDPELLSMDYPVMKSYAFGIQATF